MRVRWPSMWTSSAATSTGEPVPDALEGRQLVEQLGPLEVDGLADLGLGPGDGLLTVVAGLGGQAVGLGLGLGHLAGGGLLGLGHGGVGGALGQEQGALDRLVALGAGAGPLLGLPGAGLGLVELAGRLPEAGLGLPGPVLHLLAEGVHVLGVVAPPLAPELESGEGFGRQSPWVERSGHRPRGPTGTPVVRPATLRDVDQARQQQFRTPAGSVRAKKTMIGDRSRPMPPSRTGGSSPAQRSEDRLGEAHGQRRRTGPRSRRAAAGTTTSRAAAAGPARRGEQQPADEAHEGWGSASAEAAFADPTLGPRRTPRRWSG